MVGHCRCSVLGLMMVMRRVDEVLRLLVDGTGGVLGTDRGCRIECDDGGWCWLYCGCVVDSGKCSR